MRRWAPAEGDQTEGEWTRAGRDDEDRWETGRSRDMASDRTSGRGHDGARRALVLGGGGVAGVAWEAGIVAGLQDAGADLTTADLIVGTSAGSIVGSFIGHGADLTEAVERSAAEADGQPAEPANVDMNAVMTAFGILFDPGIDPQQGRAQVGRLALEAHVDGAAARLERVARLVPSEDWPDQPLLITAVDTADGAFVVWDRDSGIPLPTAVTASCSVPCVFPPVEINGHCYMDGGARSVTNADLARGASSVVIIEPLAHLSPRETLRRELRELGDARVAQIGPDQAAIDVFGANVLDPALWRPAFRAGLAQAAASAPEVRAVWNA
jgi:NTE family protein